MKKVNVKQALELSYADENFDSAFDSWLSARKSQGETTTNQDLFLFLEEYFEIQIV